MSYWEHTSKSIIGTKSNILKGRKIVLCVTGSVAAVNSPSIARELMRLGAEIYTVMSFNAQKIIHPDMMHWSTGNSVIIELTGETEHVTLAGEHPSRVDLILIAPCTANTIGKIAAGIDDTPVTTVLTTGIGSEIPVIIAPAMHESMYKHPIVLENIDKLKKIGVNVLTPRFEEGKAKIPDNKEIVESVVQVFSSNQDLNGRRILITGGPTRSYLDAFRFITNPSSGKTGVALALKSMERGAEVTLVQGGHPSNTPKNIRVIQVETTEEMLETVLHEVKERKYDAAIFSAAVSDYGPTKRRMEKTPSKNGVWLIELKPLPKIIERVKETDPEICLVGFKAEYGVTDDELIERSYTRMREVGMDLIIANDVSRQYSGFGHDTNEVFIINPEKEVEHIQLSDKKEVAEKILDRVSVLLGTSKRAHAGLKPSKD